VKMCSQNWSTIQYPRVPGYCMKQHRKAFMRHDMERFSEYLNKVERGTSTIQSMKGSMLPVDILRPYLDDNKSYRFLENVDVVVEEQWSAIEEKVRSSGVFQNTIWMIDMSGSMMMGKQDTPAPIEVAVSLGLLGAASTGGVFADQVLTFSTESQWITLLKPEEAPFYDRVKYIYDVMTPPDMWGGSTNLFRAAQLVLDRLRQETDPSTLVNKDPVRLIIVSDMQFDEAKGTSYFQGKQTNLEAIRTMFVEAGYEPPSIVFWNVTGRTSIHEFPAQMNEEGVLLVSGYSPSIMKMFLENANITPDDFLQQLLESERYACLSF
jgi:Domain of unknown function (DUF2828)